MRIVIEVLGGSVGGLYKRFRQCAAPPPAGFSNKTKLLFNELLYLQKKYKYGITVRDDEEHLWRK